MPKNENPENDPIKELLENLANGSVDEEQDAPKKAAKKVTKKPVTKKASTKKATSSAAKKPTAKKKASKKIAKPKTPADIYKMMAVIDTDPAILEYRANINSVTSKCYEHLNSFIIIGYTEEGDPVQVTAAKCPKDYDALSTALQKYILDCLPKHPPGSSF
tara:strand:+ start:308 stop:790 length:483 start_codon:yes stop_codon:yes gene_type:complete